MLKARLLTALVLVLLVVPALVLLPSVGVALLLLAMVGVAGFEWQRLSGCRSRTAAWVYPLALVGLSLATMPLALSTANHWWLPVSASIWWLGITAFLIRYRSLLPGSPGRSLGLIMGVITIVPSWFALVHIHAAFGPLYLLFTFALVWVADSGAYFAGKNFGRTKLAPAISPGKTIEGVVGGAALVFVYGTLAGWFFAGSVAAGLALGVISVGVGLLSISGDLLVSLFKRQQGMKDSGRILPGHGGILDRVDSLLAAAPVMLLGLEWLVVSGWQ